MKYDTDKTVSRTKKIGGITYNVKSVFDKKTVSEKMEKLIEKRIAKSSAKK
ncbi:MAG: hypothetical protein NC120_09815 [Ruminococcus sp.]|nr:hypothetical protein [Ruminococcus sp.]